MDANENDIQQNVVDTVLNEPIRVRVHVEKLNWLHKVGLFKKTRVFDIRPLVLGTILQISKVICRMKTEEMDKTDIIRIATESIANNCELFIEIIALSIENRNAKPNRKLMKFLSDNITSKEAADLVVVIVRQMDVMSFMSSIIAVKGMSLLRQGEIIAPGEQSEE